MALIVEDGTGLTNAEALAGTDEFFAYHAKMGNDATGVDVARAEILLRRATAYYSGIYRNSLIGLRAFGAQSQDWPRRSNEPGFFDLFNYGVPREVREGIIELALVADKTDIFAPPKRGKKRVKIGPLEVDYDGNSPSQNQFVAASLKFARWLKQRPTNMARLVRS